MRHIRIAGHTDRCPGWSERGQSTVEFSLILLPVLTILFGVMEIGNLVLAYNTLADAARAGVRYAVVHGSNRSGSGTDGPSGPSANPANVVAAVQSVLTTAGLPTATGTTCPPSVAGTVSILVTYPGAQNTPNQIVTVQACYGYTPLISFLPLPALINISSTTQGTICY